MTFIIKKNKMTKHRNLKANDSDTERAVSPVDRFELPEGFSFLFFVFSQWKKLVAMKLRLVYLKGLLLYKYPMTGNTIIIHKYLLL